MKRLIFILALASGSAWGQYYNNCYPYCPPNQGYIHIPFSGAWPDYIQGQTPAQVIQRFNYQMELNRQQYFLNRHRYLVTRPRCSPYAWKDPQGPCR